MQISWLGHSCFKISHDGYSLVIDPYDLTNANYPPMSTSADAVLCSHEHRGHNYRAGVSLRGKNKIHIINWDGFKLVHMGDHGSFLTDAEKDMLFGADVLMINAGGFRAMPSDKTKPLADELCANVVIPMHYAHDGCGSRRMERVTAFTDQYMPLPIVHFYDTNTISIDKNTPAQVAVLKFMPGKM